MSETCINPAEIQQGDLMAYVDGRADKAVARHVRRCPACARRVEALVRLQAALAVSLYRRSCPTSEQLIAYFHGELGSGERLVVAQHLRQCPHCARELAFLARDERESRGAWLRAAVKVVDAVLARPQMQWTGVRTVPDGARTRPQIYRADEIEILVGQHPARTHPRRYDIVGQVHIAGRVPETIGEARVELYRGEGLIAVETVSPRGQFTFEALPAADYDLGLVWGQREVRLRGVQVP